MIRVGVIGYGYWGPNIVRNLHGSESTTVKMICDCSSSALARARKAYPGVQTVSDPKEVLRSPRNRCGGRDYACLDSLRAGKASAGKRQARFR
jgi:predicted dehydrogenase